MEVLRELGIPYLNFVFQGTAMSIQQRDPDDGGADHEVGHEGRQPHDRQLLWFIALWLIGVTSTALLVLP
ncbi:hypothetical protein [Caballeronia catudaia]|uniref:hypothetical protein n=1 Tax=Caballeronia catudaia TaxID=1777136 RepID=UPI0011813CE6|nr:hypothetical protein [Caballeronia catudaia]